MDYPTKVADLGATAHYRLGESSGTAIVDAIGGSSGTYVNTPDLAQAGAIRDGDTAVNFKSASSEYGTLTTLGTFGSSLGTCSVAFWIKTTTTTKSAICGFTNSGTVTGLLIQAATSFNGTQTSNDTRFWIRNEAGTVTQCHVANSTVYDGNWHHIVAVMNGGWVIYVDGLAVTTSNASGDGTGTYANLSVGMDIASQNGNGSHTLPLNGALDEVAFFPSRLTADDAANLWFEGAIRTDYGSTQTSGTYYNAVQALSPNLYWRLDEPATTYYAKDISGNGHDGFYLGPDISAGYTGYVDGNKSVRLTNEAGSGSVRALTYSPFQPNAQLTVVGISRWDEVLNSPAGFQNFFADDTFANTGPVLEGGLSSVANPAPPDNLVRWYGNVNGQTGRYVDFYNNATPQQGKSAWFHWAFVYDDTILSAKLYINGSLVTAHAGVLGDPATGLVAGGRFQIANRTGFVVSTTENWQGEHDEIAVFERLLSANEIAGLYTAMGGAGLILLESGDEYLLETTAVSYLQSEAVTAASLTFGSSTGASSATLAIKAKTLVPLGASTGVTSATLALKAKTGIPLGAATGVSSATLALKAKTLIALAASTGASSATLALKAKTLVPLVAASGVSSATLSVTAAAPPAQIVPCAASQGQSSATLALHVPTRLTFGSSTGTSSATLALRAPAKLTLALSAGLSSATLALRAPAKLTLGAASAVSSATLALKAKALLSLAASSGQSTATLTLKARALLDLDHASSASSATLTLLARAYVVLDPADDGGSSASLHLFVLTVVPLGASSGQSSASIDILRPPLIPLQASTALSAAALTLWVQTRVPLGAVAAHSGATLTVIGPQRAYLTLGDSNAISSARPLLIHYAVLLAPSSGVSTTGLLGVYTPTLVALNVSLGVSGGELTVFFPFTFIALTPAFAHSFAHLLMGMSLLVFEQQSEQGTLSFGEHGIMAEDRVGRVIQNTA